eukprot:gene29925-39724_t
MAVVAAPLALALAAVMVAILIALVVTLAIAITVIAAALGRGGGGGEAGHGDAGQRGGSQEFLDHRSSPDGSAWVAPFSAPRRASRLNASLCRVHRRLVWPAPARVVGLIHPATAIGQTSRRRAANRSHRPAPWLDSPAFRRRKEAVKMRNNATRRHNYFLAAKTSPRRHGPPTPVKPQHAVLGSAPSAFPRLAPAVQHWATKRPPVGRQNSFVLARVLPALRADTRPSFAVRAQRNPLLPSPKGSRAPWQLRDALRKGRLVHAINREPRPAMRIAIASDHAAFALKAVLAGWLRGQGHDVLDLGPDSDARVDYPDYGFTLARAVADGRAERGVALCGSGIGISIAVNRHPALRCALVDNPYAATLDKHDGGRAHARCHWLRCTRKSVKQPAQQPRQATADNARTAQCPKCRPIRRGSCGDRGAGSRANVAFDWSDKTIAMLWNGFDKHRPRGVIRKHTAQAANTLCKCLVGDRNTAPDIVHELVFRHKRAGIGCEQDKRIEIAAGDIDDGTIHTMQDRSTGILAQSVGGGGGEGGNAYGMVAVGGGGGSTGAGGTVTVTNNEGGQIWTKGILSNAIFAQSIGGGGGNGGAAYAGSPIG